MANKSVEERISFIKSNEDLARKAFQVSDHGMHKTPEALKLSEMARVELGYAKRTAQIGIYYALRRTAKNKIGILKINLWMDCVKLLSYN